MRFSLSAFSSVLLSLTCLLVFSAPALASTVVELDLESLVANSDDVIIGKVQSVESRVEEDGRVYSYITISVSEALKGDHEEELVIRQIGGRADDLVTYVPGMPEFVAEEEVFLFVERVTAKKIPVVTGLSQGKFSINVGPDARTQFVVPQARDLHMVRPQTKEAQPAPDINFREGVPEGMRLREVQPGALYS
ncbi:MAG: hypothetical protein ACNA8W_04565, partial [Bradymonadaceae bacterium]